MARFGYDWQVPYRVAVPGYQEYMLKHLNQMTFFAANIQELIESTESLVRRDFGVVKGYHLNQQALPESPVARLAKFGLPKVSLITGATLTGTTNKTNILAGYLMIKAQMPNAESRLLFDDGNGNLISYNMVMGTVNYAAGTYALNTKGTEYVKGATSFQVTFCDGTVNYPERIASTQTDTYEVSGATPKAGGTNYVVGDEVEASGATFKVTEIGESGAVTTVELVKTVKSATDVAGDATATGGSGTGLELTITTTKTSVSLLKCEGAIFGAAASLPGVAIYYTDLTDKVYVGYATSDAKILGEIFDALKVY